MSPGYRLWRAARRRVLESLGLVQGAAFRSPRQRAWRDLEELLRERGAGPSGSRGAAAPRLSPYECEYRLLGAPIGAGIGTVLRCWRERVRETHPDHFAHDPEAQRCASERLIRINAAYERLRKHLTGHR